MGLGQSYDRWKNNRSSELPPVVLASGPETELKEDCLAALRDRFDTPPDDVTFYADETSPEDFIQELQGRGLFNDSKIVVLKHLERRAPGQGHQMARYESVLETYLEDPEEDVLLFLMDSDHPYRNSRRTGAVAGMVEDVGGESIIFWEPFDDSLRDYVRDAFADAGQSIKPPAVQALLKRTRGNYSRLKREVEKLIESVRGTVNRDDVEALVTRQEASDGYQALKDNIVSDNPDGVLRDLDDLWRQGDAPPKVFHVVFRFLNSVREVKQLRAEGESMDLALEQAGLPSNKSVKSLFKRAVNPSGVSLSRDFYGRSYETNRTSKYSSDPLGRRSVEMFILRLLLQGTG